jgi:integrase
MSGTGPRKIQSRGTAPAILVIGYPHGRGADTLPSTVPSPDVTTHAGLRDRALIGLMVYSFARIGAAFGTVVEDVYTQDRRLWVRLREKGGKRHAMPCHHNLEEYLTAYLDGAELRGGSKRATVPHDRTRHWQAHAHGAAASKRLCDDRPARVGGRHRYQARQPQLPGDRDHGKVNALAKSRGCSYRKLWS